MIQINLLPGQKRKAGGAERRFKIPDLRTIVTQIKDPWLIGAVAVAVVAIGGNLLLFGINGARLARVKKQYDAVTIEKRRYDKVVDEKRKQERSRDSLAAEMAIIRSIDADRYVWPHMLDQITKALPPYTWLTTVQFVGAGPAAGQPAPSGTPQPADTTSGPKTVSVSIDGRTVDIQAYTTFLRQLSASPWFTDVYPTNASTVIESDRPVTAFNVTARYRVADLVYIHTVPLVQSVR
ncbi:MAG TPA: PilN domain-containing protein [Gemmatimonadales bacterium]|nr:PilN domain-containing protein [Gemmatimonadales bacterium]